MDDPREQSAKFYDFDPRGPDDIPFYIARLPSPDSRVLELGCGTGRVTIPLAAHSASVLGLDSSEAMLTIARAKVHAAGLEDRVRLEPGDVSSFQLPGRFDFVIAPFRVLQNLESDTQVQGLLRCIRTHLAPGGRCILNAFRPSRDPAGMRAHWVTSKEELSWEVHTPDGRVACYDRHAGMDAERLVLYPELVYRRFEGDRMVEEAILKIAMRCYYPNELTALIESHGFEVLQTWGGYAGETYGEGSELVVEFTAA